MPLAMLPAARSYHEATDGEPKCRMREKSGKGGLPGLDIVKESEKTTPSVHDLVSMKNRQKVRGCQKEIIKDIVYCYGRRLEKTPIVPQNDPIQWKQPLLRLHLMRQDMH